MTTGSDTWQLSSRPLRGAPPRSLDGDRKGRRENPRPTLETAAIRFEEAVATPPLTPMGPAWHEQAGVRALLLVAVWAALVLGWQTPIALPIRLLTVVFHELGHALACIATGGTVHAVVVHPDGSGLTLSQGGIQVAVLNGALWGHRYRSECPAEHSLA